MEKKRSRRNKIIILILTIVVMVVITLNSKIFKSKPKHIADFTKEQALEEFDYMWEVIEREYPYLDAAERIYCVYSSELKNLGREKIMNLNDISIEEHLSILQDSLTNYNGLGHLSIVPPEIYNLFLSNIEAAPLDESQSCFRTWEEQATQEKSVETYSYLSKASSNIIKLENNKTSSNYVKDNISIDLRYPETIIFRVKAFSYENIDIDTKYVRKILKENDECTNIVIDLSSCAGGTDSYFYDVFVNLLSNERLQMNPRYILTKQNSISNVLEEIPYLEIIDKKIIEDFPNIRESDIKNLDLAYKVNTSTYIPTDVDKCTGKKVFVLINENTQSAAETAASFCKDTGFATLIGNNTGGNSGAMNPFYYPLPYSGLILSFNIEYVVDSLGNSISEIGIAPDFYSIEDESLVDTYFRLYKNGEI